MLISDEVVLRLNALAALWSRKLPLPESYSAPAPENRLHEAADPLPVIPDDVVRPPERRNAKPVEQMPDGTWRKQGYSRRKPRAGWLDWSVPINDRDE